MKGMVKAIIAGCIFIAIGVAVLLIALGLNGWSFTPEYEMTTYSTENAEISTEIETIKLNFNAGKVRTEFYDKDYITVKYPQIKNYNTDIEVKDGVFTFTGPNKLHWYSFPLGWGNLPETVIKLPQNTEFNMDLVVNAGVVNIPKGTYKSLKVTMNAGKVTIDENTICSDFSCIVGMGAAELKGITCTGKFDCKGNFSGVKIDKLTCDDITLEANAGGIDLKIVGNQADYTIIIENSVAGCNIEEQTGTTDKTLTIEANAGGVNVEFIS